MPIEPSLYEILEVDHRASQEVIEAAYHRLAKKYHPDLNKSPDAMEVMQRLNYAYQTLSDPQRRKEYDLWFFGKEHHATPKEAEPRAEQNASPKPIACQNCGRVDVTLRATVFTYVVSILVMSFKRGGGAGILCSKCRTTRGFGYSLLSVLLGPWGIPWGIFWALEAVFTNLSGGKQPAEINGPLLRAMGAYFWSIGSRSEAIAALESSLRFEENAEVREALRQLSNEGRKAASTVVRRAPSTSQSAFGVVVIGMVVVLLLTCTGIAILSQPVNLQHPATTNTSLPIAAGLNGNLLPGINPTNSPVPPNIQSGSEYPLAQVTSIPSHKMWVCNADSVEVHSGPGSSFPIVKRFNLTAEDWSITVYGQAGEWYYVGYNELMQDQFIHKLFLCDYQPTPSASTVFGGPMDGAWRVGIVEWAATGYRLVDYGRQIELPMVFHNNAQWANSETVVLDFSLNVDGQEFLPNSVSVAKFNPDSWTYSDPKTVNRGSIQLLDGGEYIAVILYFDTPPGRATDQQADAFMEQKRTTIEWLQHKLRYIIHLSG